MFSFLYRVFYDRTLFGTFVKNGKGYGIKLLFILALFVSLCSSVRIFLIFSRVTPQNIAVVMARMPEIVFENGKIISPSEYKFVYLANKNFFFVFDTTKEPPQLKDLPERGVYVVDDAVTIINKDKASRLLFSQVLDGRDLVLNQDSVRMFCDEMLPVYRTLIPLVVFIISLIGTFLVNVFLALCYTLVAGCMARLTGKILSWPQKMRLAALSITPFYILNAVGILIGLSVSFSRFNVLITLIYMFCFLKDPKADDKSEQLIDKQI